MRQGLANREDLDAGLAASSLERFLVERARRRDWNAFEELVARHRSRIWSLAFETLKDRTAAERVLQATFVTAWEKLPRHATGEPFASWLRELCAPILLRRARGLGLFRTVRLGGRQALSTAHGGPKAGVTT